MPSCWEKAFMLNSSVFIYCFLFYLSISISEDYISLFKMKGKITMPSCGHNLLLCQALSRALNIVYVIAYNHWVTHGTIFNLIQSGTFDKMVWILGPPFLSWFPFSSQVTAVYSRLVANGAERYYSGVLCSFITWTKVYILLLNIIVAVSYLPCYLVSLWLFSQMDHFNWTELCRLCL